MATKAEDGCDAADKAGPVSGTRPRLQGQPGLRCVHWAALETEIAAWNALAEEAVEPNPFFESWYLLPSLHHLPDTGSVSILRYEVNGHLAGLMPIRHERRYYGHPVPTIQNWLHPNSFCGLPLVARGHEEGFWRSVLDWADRQGGTGLFLHFRGMTLDGPLHGSLEALAASDRRQFRLAQEEARAMLASDLSAEAYLEASLTGKKRKELRRQANRLADEGAVTFERRTDDVGLKQWCDTFLKLESSGWKGKARSALACDTSTSRLFHQSLTGAAALGRLERLTLSLDGKPIAMLATFLTPPGAFSYKTAFDEAFARFSPGVLLQRENLAVLERPDIEWSDSCAAADHPMIDHLWRERRRIGSVSVAIGGLARRTAFRLFSRIEAMRASTRAAQGTPA